MKKIPWNELKTNLLKLELGNDPITIGPEATIMDEKKFVESHISAVDSAPSKDNYTIREKRYRLYIIKPFYDRLLIYYFLKTELQGAF